LDELDEIREKKMKEMMGKKESVSKEYDSPIEGSDESFDEIIKSNFLVIVDFWAEWCGPCNMVAPVMETLAKEYSGKVLFLKINVDKCPNTASKFGIMSIPTLMIFKDGKAVDQIIGAVPKTFLESKLQNHM
jgi:thioredoxin 1